MVVKTKEQISAGVVKIASDTGSAFFLRVDYLSFVCEDEIFAGASFSEEREDDLLSAGLSYAVEVRALSYLARCEQNRFSLSAKLMKKGFEKKHVEMALDYLEGEGFLSDYRFASAWLSSRKINRFEGRSRLSAELMARGVKKDDAERALDEFFDENSEDDLCRKCYEKLLRTSAPSDSSGQKIIRSMLRNGFSYSRIKRIMDGD